MGDATMANSCSSLFLHLNAKIMHNNIIMCYVCFSLGYFFCMFILLYLIFYLSQFIL